MAAIFRAEILAPPILGPASGAGFELRPGRLEVATSGDLPQWFAGLSAPEAPRSVAVRLGVAERALTRTWLARQRVPLLSDERYLLRVGPEQCCGAVIEFAEVDRDGSKA